MDDTNNGVKTLLYLLRLRLQNTNGGLQEVIQKLVDEGSLFTEDNGGVGVSLLHSVIAKGYASDVRLLLDQSGDLAGLINCSNHCGNSPLHVAANTEYLEVVDILLERKAEVNKQRTLDKYTPLHIAALGGKTATAKRLLEKGADVSMWNLYGNRPLHLAAGMGHCELLRVLLAAGAALEDKNSIGNTPLANAARNDQEQVVELLLSRGADPNVLYAKQLALLEVMMKEQLPYVALQLLRYGASLPNYSAVKSWLQSRRPKMLEREMLVFLAILLSGNDPLIITDMLRDARSKLVRYPKPLRTWLDKNANGPCQLKFICRQRIRHHLLTKYKTAFGEMLQTLPLPGPMKEFLLLSDLSFIKKPMRIVFRSEQLPSSATPWTGSSPELNLTIELET